MKDQTKKTKGANHHVRMNGHWSFCMFVNRLFKPHQIPSLNHAPTPTTNYNPSMEIYSALALRAFYQWRPKRRGKKNSEQAPYGTGCHGSVDKSFGQGSPSTTSVIDRSGSRKSGKNKNSGDASFQETGRFDLSFVLPFSFYSCFFFALAKL